MDFGLPLGLGAFELRPSPGAQPSADVFEYTTLNRSSTETPRQRNTRPNAERSDRNRTFTGDRSAPCFSSFAQISNMLLTALGSKVLSLAAISRSTSVLPQHALYKAR